MPRLFTGIQIPRDIATDLATLRGGLPGARWIEPEDYHLTLRFIGDVGLVMANDILVGLESIRGRKTRITVDRLAAFGADKPRALFAKVVTTSGLIELQADHERLMRRLGAKADTRKFTPHVTLARLRGATPETVASYISARSMPDVLVFDATEFVLYSARDSTGGGPYRSEAVYPL